MFRCQTHCDRRNRLRTPAILGIFLLLVGSGIDASGIGVCQMHGHGLHDHSGELHGTEGSGSSGLGAEVGNESAHHHHEDAHEHAPAAPLSGDPAATPASPMAGPIHSLPEHGCECRMVCAAAAGAPAPAPGAPALAELDPPTERRPLVATDDPVAFHLLPFAIPFANGPPPVA